MFSIVTWVAAILIGGVCAIVSASFGWISIPACAAWAIGGPAVVAVAPFLLLLLPPFLLFVLGGLRLALALATGGKGSGAVKPAVRGTKRLVPAGKLAGWVKSAAYQRGAAVVYGLSSLVAAPRLRSAHNRRELRGLVPGDGAAGFVEADGYDIGHALARGAGLGLLILLVLVVMGLVLACAGWAWSAKRRRENPQADPPIRTLMSTTRDIGHMTYKKKELHSEKADQSICLGDIPAYAWPFRRTAKTYPLRLSDEATLCLRVAGPGTGKTTGDLACAIFGAGTGTLLPGWDGGGAGFRGPIVVSTTAPGTLDVLRGVAARLRAYERPGVTAEVQAAAAAEGEGLSEAELTRRVEERLDEVERDGIAVWTNDPKILGKKQFEIVAPYLRYWSLSESITRPPLEEVAPGVFRPRGKSVVEQAQQLAEHQLEAQSAIADRNTAFFLSECEPLLVALLLASHWSGNDSPTALAKWANGLSNPIQQTQKLAWAQAWITERQPNLEENDPGPTPEEVLVWQTAAAKLASVTGPQAGGHMAGIMSTLQQQLAAWADPSLAKVVSTCWPDGTKVARRLDLRHILGGNYRALLIIADGEGTKIAKSRILSQALIASARDTAIQISVERGERRSGYRCAFLSDEYQSLCQCPNVASWANQDRAKGIIHALFTQNLAGVKAILGEQGLQDIMAAADAITLGAASSSLGSDAWSEAAQLLGKAMRQQVSRNIADGASKGSKSISRQLSDVGDGAWIRNGVVAGQQLMLAQNQMARLKSGRNLSATVILARSSFASTSGGPFADIQQALRWIHGRAIPCTSCSYCQPRRVPGMPWGWLHGRIALCSDPECSYCQPTRVQRAYKKAVKRGLTGVSRRRQPLPRQPLINKIERLRK